MAQSAGSPQHDDVARSPGPRALEKGTLEKGALEKGASRWPRLDQAAYALAVGLAALISIVATASLGGFEVAGAHTLGLTEEPVSGVIRPDHPPSSDRITDDGVTIGQESNESGIDEPVAPTDAGQWFATDIDERVRYDTERSSLIGSAAMAQLSYDWQGTLPAWRIDFVEGNDRVAGYTWSQEQRIEVFIRPNASSADVARILAHELGHAVDVTLNSGQERQAWLTQRGADDTTQWWPSSGAADFETGAGDFAECFAVWLVGSADYRSVVGPAPSAADLELIAQLAT